MNAAANTTVGNDIPALLNFMSSLEAEIIAVAAIAETVAKLVDQTTETDGRAGEVLLSMTRSEADHLAFFANEVAIRARRLKHLWEMEGAR